MKHILIITGGTLPVPAVKGGAVETLVDSLITVNQQEQQLLLDVVSVHPGKGELLAGANYHFVKYPIYVRLWDQIVYFYNEYLKKDWRSMFLGDCKKISWYANHITNRLDLNTYDRIVVENNVSLLGPLKKVLGEDFGKKCIFHMHSVLVDNLDMLPALSDCRCIFAVSECVKNEVRKIPPLQDTAIRVLRNGVATTSFSAEERHRNRLEICQKHRIDPQKNIFLYSGRISSEKGVLELVQAFSQARMTDSVLLVCGGVFSGLKRKSLYAQQVWKESKDADVIFTGYIPCPDMPMYYSASDVLVVPSVVPDAAPLTVLEGMHYGLFLVYARIGGIPEYISDYKRKLDVQPGEGFSVRLCQALQDCKAQLDLQSDASIPYTQDFYYREFLNALEAMEG